MNTYILDYLKSLSKEQRQQFIEDVGTTNGYMNQVAYGRKAVGPEFALRLEAFSGRALNAEVLCPDFPWAYAKSRGN